VAATGRGRWATSRGSRSVDLRATVREGEGAEVRRPMVCVVVLDLHPYE
jgi:hypothetical protein